MGVFNRLADKSCLFNVPATTCIVRTIVNCLVSEQSATSVDFFYKREPLHTLLCIP